jgi:hypothetical protein
VWGKGDRGEECKEKEGRVKNWGAREESGTREG